MSQRNFNNSTTIGTLSAPAASSATTLTVSSFSGYPAVPFTITVDRNTATEEICLVTAAVAGTLTVTRGFDGTAAQAHSAGAAVEHTAGAIEYTEANAHVNATADVHGVTGVLVGAEGSQSLFDKTLVSAVSQADVTAGDAVVAYVPPGAEVRKLFRGVDSAGSDVITVDSSGNLSGQAVTDTGKRVARNWGIFTGNTLPSSGVQLGDTCFSATLNCSLIWSKQEANLGWHQATLAVCTAANPTATAFQAAVTATGLNFLHAGFQVFDGTKDRLYVADTLTTLALVGGKPTARVTTAWTPGAGWTVANQYLKSVGNGMAMCYAEFTKTGSALTVVGDGNIGNAIVATLPAGWAPTDTSYTVSGATGRLCNYALNTTGTVQLLALVPGQDLAVGGVISVGGVYALANPVGV